MFIDDDGQAYYYWGQFSAHGAKLADNMVEMVPGSQVDALVTEEEHFFHEGCSLRKRGDTYYLVYTSIERGRANSLSYATSSSPLGPFVHRGVIIDNGRCDPASWNNHGSIECVQGQWYVFHHRSSRNSQKWRRLTVEPISFDADGLIPEVRMSSQGAGAPFVLGERIDAWRACEVGDGAWIGPDETGREVLHVLTPGAEAVFRWIHLDQGAQQIDIGGAGDGIVEIMIDDSGTPAGEVRIVDGATVDGRLDVPAGQFELALRVRASADLRLSSLTFH